MLAGTLRTGVGVFWGVERLGVGCLERLPAALMCNIQTLDGEGRFPALKSTGRVRLVVIDSVSDQLRRLVNFTVTVGKP